MKKIELPDLVDIGKLAEKIKELSELVGLLGLQIKIEETNINREAISNEKYFVNGKSPSQAYIDSTFKTTGFSGELVPLREQLIKRESELELCKMQYRFLLLMIDLWRTQEASERLINA